jgi:hypothetical protein
MEDEDIHSGGLSAPHTPLDGFQIFLGMTLDGFQIFLGMTLNGFQIFLGRFLHSIHQMNALCICFAILFNWMNRFGMRIAALEKKIEEIERHVIIDMDAENGNK